MSSAVVFIFVYGIAFAIWSVFSKAILAFVGFAVNFVLPDIITDILGVISVYLPFNPASCFSVFFTVSTAILTFLIAHKTFNILMQVLGAVHS